MPKAGGLNVVHSSQGKSSDGSRPIPPHPGEQPATSCGPCHSTRKDQVPGTATLFCAAEGRGDFWLQGGNPNLKGTRSSISVTEGGFKRP